MEWNKSYNSKMKNNKIMRVDEDFKKLIDEIKDNYQKEVGDNLSTTRITKMLVDSLPPEMKVELIKRQKRRKEKIKIEFVKFKL